jgi:hypothetical protein
MGLKCEWIHTHTHTRHECAVPRHYLYKYHLFSTFSPRLDTFRYLLQHVRPIIALQEDVSHKTPTFLPRAGFPRLWSCYRRYVEPLTLVPDLHCMMHESSPLAVATRFITAPLTAFASPLPRDQHIQNAVGRRYVSALTTRQLHFIMPASDQTYRSWAAEQGRTPAISTFDKSRIFWVGPQKNKKVLLWAHGGGFALALTKGHAELAKRLVEGNEGLSVALLEYGEKVRASILGLC